LIRTSFFFLFTDPAPPASYTLSLHDALPIFQGVLARCHGIVLTCVADPLSLRTVPAAARVLATARVSNPKLELMGVLIEQFNDADRKSTRLNSSHVKISYAVFCLKKKKKKTK